MTHWTSKANFLSGVNRGAADVGGVVDSVRSMLFMGKNYMDAVFVAAAIGTTIASWVGYHGTVGDDWETTREASLWNGIVFTVFSVWGLWMTGFEGQVAGGWITTAMFSGLVVTTTILNAVAVDECHDHHHDLRGYLIAALIFSSIYSGMVAALVLRMIYKRCTK